MHGLQRTHQCPCAPTQIQVALARFPTPVVPEPPAVLAGSVRLAAQPLAGWAQQGPVAVSGPPVRLVLPELLALQAASVRLVPWVQVLLGHLAGWVRSVQRERLEPLVLAELAVQLVRPGPRALRVR